MTVATTPVRVLGLSSAVQVSSGVQTTCARTAAAEVFCWGSNEQWTTGVADLGVATVDVPRRVAGLISRDVAVSGNTACSLGLNGAVHCWGANNVGEAGIPTSDSTFIVIGSPPTPLFVTAPAQVHGI